MLANDTTGLDWMGSACRWSVWKTSGERADCCWRRLPGEGGRTFVIGRLHKVTEYTIRLAGSASSCTGVQNVKTGMPRSPLTNTMEAQGNQCAMFPAMGLALVYCKLSDRR
jgi:hypothetical protein